MARMRSPNEWYNDDLSGKRFGDLTVLASTEYRDNENKLLICRCDEGHYTLVRKGNLTKTSYPSLKCCVCHPASGGKKFVRRAQKNNKYGEVGLSFDENQNRPRVRITIGGNRITLHVGTWCDAAALRHELETVQDMYERMRSNVE